MDHCYAKQLPKCESVASQTSTITSKFPDIAAEHNYYKTKKGKMSPNETSSDKPYFTSCPNNKNNFEEILNPVSSVLAIYSGKSASPEF